jgi:hypothetical protein
VRKRTRWAVTTGNLGWVHDGFVRKEAEKHFREYKEQSKSGYGRAAGESVVLWKTPEGGEPEIVREYAGTRQRAGI